MKAAKLIFIIISYTIVSSIWAYLLYYILTKIEASELALFLYWVYIPVWFIVLIGNAVIKVYDDERNDTELKKEILSQIEKIKQLINEK